MLFAGLAILALSSCKKDKDKNDPAPGPGTNARLLKKVTQVEGNQTTVYNLTYDAAKKLQSIISADNKEKTLFTYDAAGNLTKVDETEEEFHNIYTYTYANGVPATGTFKSWQLTAGEPDDLIEDDLLTYTVTNNVVTKIHLNMTQAAMEADFELNYTNGNLTNVKSVGNDWFKADFTFGTKKSAFPVVSKWVLDQAGFSLQFASKNELIRAAYDFPGAGLDKVVTSTYTYDAAGYPLTSNDGEVKLTFEYF